jgi:hypothetical protein
MTLTPAPKRAEPQPTDLPPKCAQRRRIRRHAIVADVSADDAAQPRALLANGAMHASPQFGFHLLQLRLHPFANRVPQHGESSIASLLPADMREAQKRERLRLAETAAPTVQRREWPEFQQPRFLGMYLQMKRPKPLGQFHPKPFGVRLVLEAHHEVVGEAHDDDIAVRALLTPCVCPQVKHVVKIDVRQPRRRTAALRRAFRHSCSLPLFQHTGVQPFLDEPYDAPVRDAVLEKSDEPSVVDGVKGPYDTLPISRTCPSGSPSFVQNIRSKGDH